MTTGEDGPGRPRRRRARHTAGPLAVVTLAVVLLVAGCQNLRQPNEPEVWDDTDLTFAVSDAAGDGAGGVVLVGGSMWERRDASGTGTLETGTFPWLGAVIAAAPDGRFVVGTTPGGQTSGTQTQSPQIVLVDVGTGTDDVLVGRPGQRPLPLVPGAPVSPDGTPASDAYLGTVLDVEVMSDGSAVWVEQLWVEFADQDIFVVRRLAADGTLETLAGRPGDPAAVPVAPSAGAVGRDVVLDGADPRLAAMPDGGLVVGTRSWTVGVGPDGVLTEVVPGLSACDAEPTLVESDDEGLLLVRVGADPAPTRTVDGWVVAEPSDHAQQIVSASQDASVCSVVAVRAAAAPATAAEVEVVPDLRGASGATFLGDDALVAVYRGSGDQSALLRVSLP
ncbi:hypothetical protein [Sanguibacter sp. 25GB23B1]|uniref:hypothetical protein n=1 Tax=unclassified Sanguibacter TaxID=2645534 RepID=UPI0032AF78BF